MSSTVRWKLDAEGSTAVGVVRSSKLGNRLQLADHPAVGTRRHQHDIVHNHMFVVDGFTAVKNLQIVVGGVMQFDHVAFGSIKNSFDLMILVEVARAEAAV